MGQKYSITITNQSAHPDYFMIYQNDPGSFSPNAQALAWFSKYSHPNSVVKFQWEIEWGFSWADVGALAPGVVYTASEILTATPSVNKVTLDYDKAFRFVDPDQGEDPSLLYIQETASIPINSSGAVGITMAGETVYAVQARPNTSLTFTPHPVYYLAYGDFVDGMVLDLSSINNPLALNYDKGIYSLAVTLNPNDTWGPITTTAQRNQRFLAARKANPELNWAQA